MSRASEAAGGAVSTTEKLPISRPELELAEESKIGFIMVLMLLLFVL